MWLKWLPWRMVLKRLAKERGFLDPINFLSQLQRFSQPSEVQLPVEIFRLGTLLHARGLINSQAIQHNLDWVWPFWAERQFDPQDPAFTPRAFSVSHINLTHRNWTAVGIPGCPDYSLVDPAGLVTPLFDAWSIDSWIIPDKGEPLLPSRLKEGIHQQIPVHPELCVATESAHEGCEMRSVTSMKGNVQEPECEIRVQAKSARGAWCAIVLRPYNPEGIQFIHEIRALKGQPGWRVNAKTEVYLSEAPNRWAYSDYRSGDVFRFLPQARQRDGIACDVGMATAAALYELKPGAEREIVVRVPLKGKPRAAAKPSLIQELWDQALAPACRLKIPDARFQFLYDVALRMMVLHSPREVYPGPYTYKHFWFRDAAFILNALISAGFVDLTENVINHTFFTRLSPFGYFYSQDGEWDSNGQALWTLRRFCELSGKKPRPEWKRGIEKAAKWIIHKRLPSSLQAPHAGLLPAGFSAEHLGPNDYYYWDDFWSVAGLRAAAWFMEHFNNGPQSATFNHQADELLDCIERSLKHVQKNIGVEAIPASPYRRMDTGAIGSLAPGYPLQLWGPLNPNLMGTIHFLMENCRVHHAFFHDMSHSGINPYLTLHIAQILLRAGDPRYYEVMKSVGDLASPTGQWPEAIHPGTLGGCMGDGQHIWAAAEWVLMIHSCFVREEGEKLILFSGVPAAWLQGEEAIELGPVRTRFGSISLKAAIRDEKAYLSWHGNWSGAEPEIEIQFLNAKPFTAEPGRGEAVIGGLAVP